MRCMSRPSTAQRISSIRWAGPRLMLRLHRAGLGFSTVTWPEFAARVEQARPDAVTVDVFETCVVRDLAGDQAIEDVAARWVGQEVADSAGDIDPDTRYAKAAAKLELDLCKPVPGAAEALDRIRATVGQVVFISDTDRSSALLTELLDRHGLYRAEDRVVASCEEGVTKSRGGLYDLIWSSRPAVVWHVGNNNWADGVMAAAHRYEPFDIPAGNLSRYEATLCSNPGGMGPVLAGAARSTRLELEDDYRCGRLDERTFQLNRLGAQVAGPVIASFNLWVADQVRNYDIDHLGFLARDGELPQLIAERMPDLVLQSTSRSYVHLNRLAVTLATAASVGIDAWVNEGTQDDSGFLFARMHTISFGGLLQRLGFEPDDLAHVMGRSFGLVNYNQNEPLGKSDTQDWLAVLSSQAARELILSRATERRSAIVDYLDQLGLLTSAQPAFVDVGWRGRMASLINTALREYFVNEPIHLHFGGDRVPPEADERVRIHRFAFPGTSPIKPFENPPSPVETITASGNPRVSDYKRSQSGVIEPVYQPESIDVGRADRAAMWRGAIAMAERLPTAARISSWGLDHAALDAEARELLRLWWYEPKREEASAMRAFAFEGDEAGAEVRPVLEPYALSDVVGRNRVPRQWRQGSGAISPPASRVGLRVAMLGRRLLGR